MANPALEFKELSNLAHPYPFSVDEIRPYYYRAKAEYPNYIEKLHDILYFATESNITLETSYNLQLQIDSF